MSLWNVLVFQNSVSALKQKQFLCNELPGIYWLPLHSVPLAISFELSHTAEYKVHDQFDK